MVFVLNTTFFFIEGRPRGILSLFLGGSFAPAPFERKVIVILREVAESRFVCACNLPPENLTHKRWMLRLRAA